MSKRRYFSSLLFFSVSVVAILVDLALLRAVKYSSFTPVYAFGLLAVAVAFFVLAGLNNRKVRSRAERKAAKRAERIAAGEKLEPLKPHKDPWYTGGLGFLFIVFVFFVVIGFYSINKSGLSVEEYGKKYGSAAESDSEAQMRETVLKAFGAKGGGEYMCFYTIAEYEGVQGEDFYKTAAEILCDEYTVQYPDAKYALLVAFEPGSDDTDVREAYLYTLEDGSMDSLHYAEVLLIMAAMN